MRSGKVLIIGAGWYGLFIALELGRTKTFEEIVVVERAPNIFEVASRFNQCRLHLGFHYARSHETRQLCRQGYAQFLEAFPDISYSIPHNWYAIATESVLDFETYKSIFTHEGYNFSLVENECFQHVDGQLIQVDERGIDPKKAAEFFRTALDGKVNFRFNHTVTMVDSANSCVRGTRSQAGGVVSDFVEHFDYCYDCTNFRVPHWPGSNIEANYENTLTLLYRKIAQVPFGALTVVDGPFFSIFPYERSADTFSLTHVKYTPLSTVEIDIPHIRQCMEQDVVKFFPNFLQCFEYIGFFTSPKTKPFSSTDSRRLMQLQSAPNVEQISCGKITGIFQIKFR